MTGGRDIPGAEFEAGQLGLGGKPEFFIEEIGRLRYVEGVEAVMVGVFVVGVLDSIDEIREGLGVDVELLEQVVDLEEVDHEVLEFLALCVIFEFPAIEGEFVDALEHLESLLGDDGENFICERVYLGLFFLFPFGFITGFFFLGTSWRVCFSIVLCLLSGSVFDPSFVLLSQN